MPLISELLNLPSAVHRGDFVLRLSEGITDAHAEGTLRDYVVTPALAENFHDALGFIRGALEARSSKASYLHGSFGSGKSHFMAVLYLLLRGNVKARAIPELADVVQRHQGWTEGKKFLLVPYHMIGARSMESAILGQYVDHVRRLHPDAPTPGVYLSTALVDNAVALRETMGDDAFFGALNKGKSGAGGWGNLGAAWDAARFEAAARADERDEDRVRLVGDLVDTLLPAYSNLGASDGRGFVNLDHGLSIISHHAQSLGYDGVILFLDELILWLASHSADAAFVNTEGQKLAKLVEAQDASRPIPIVSFVARQRDIRELVGEHSAGAQALAFHDVLKWWEARFHVITLEDRNLPAIAERRVLAPRSAATRTQIDAAFAETMRLRTEVKQALLADASEETFRRVYPFTPALVQVLVAVSSMLQRERTALKVMLQLLVNQRDTLQLGEVVALGDLFDVIAEGDEAFNEGTRQVFESARRLWTTKLRPMLEMQHGGSEETIAQLDWADPRRAAYRGDARVLKTLLLGSLVPNVPALKALDARRLGALNHGSFRAPIPGQESALILSRLRQWAAQVGEIHISEDPHNPTVSLHITGVDVDTILRQAHAEDNPGNRLRKIRELVFRLCGIEDRNEFFLSRDVVWRGTKRRVDVLFGNVRDMPTQSLRARGGDWLVVIDFPFDDHGRTPADDRRKVEDFLSREAPSHTVVWIPAFFSLSSLNDLKQLVLMDHVLAGERLSAYSAHLTATERAMARALLENQRSQLWNKLRYVVEAAYGIGTAPDGALDTSLEHELADHFKSLDPSLALRPPVATDMRSAFDHLVHQALAHQFPRHPGFEVEELRPAMLRKVYAEVQRAVEEKDHRLFVEASDVRRLLRQIAVPLELAQMGEQHLVLGDTWVRHFRQRASGQHGPMTVRKLRAWLDEPEPRGLPTEVANLVILTFAELQNLRFTLHGGPAQPTLDALPDDLELHEVDLPTPEQWMEARERASRILGLGLLELRTASNVGDAAARVQEAARGLKPAAGALVHALETRLNRLQLPQDASLRLRTARAALALVSALEEAPAERVVQTLASASLDVAPATIGTSLKSAAAVSASLQQVMWTVVEPAIALDDDARAAAAVRLRKQLAEALQADQYVTPLEPFLTSLQASAAALLARVPHSVTVPGTRRQRREGLTVPEARRVLDDVVKADPDATVSIEWTETVETTER